MGSAQASTSPIKPIKFPAITLLLALLTVIASVVLSNYYWLPVYIFCLLVLPSLAISLFISDEFGRLSSIILFAAFLYNVSLVLSTVFFGSTSYSQVLPKILQAALILSFFVSIGLLYLRLLKFIDYFLAVVIIIMAASALVNVIGFFEANVHPQSLADYRLVPILGTPKYQGSTTVSTTYAVFSVAAFSLVLVSRWRWISIALIVAGAILLLGTALTQARGAVLGVFAGALVATFWLPRRRLLIAAGVIGCMFLVCLYPPFWEALWSRGSSYRDGIWLSYLQMASERPVLGYGILANIHRVVEGFEFFHAHNILLSSEIRGGLLGLVSLCVVILSSIYFSTKWAKQSGDPTILSMVVALVTASMFDYEIMITFPDWFWITFWLPFALAAGTEVGLRSTLPFPSFHPTDDRLGGISEEGRFG